MNVIKINDVSDLKVICDTHMFFSDSEDKEIELRENMWAIMFAPCLPNKISLFDLQLFFTQFIENKKQEVKSINIHPITFYVWYDAQLKQLCFNICSFDKKNLPFGCKVKFVDSLSLILKQFLDAEHYGGLFPIDEIMIDETLDCDDEESFVLDVYTANLL